MTFRLIAAGLAASLATLASAAALALFLAPATAQAQMQHSTAAAAPPAAVPAADKTYVLGPADVVEVSVLGRTDFTTRARIAEDGTIQVPYLGTVHPGGKTAAEFADDLAAALEKGGFYSHPIMSVEIVSYASRYVTVLGEVGTPGLIPVDRAYRLSEILARVGGIKEPEADTVILTHGSTPPERLSVRALATGNPADDPFVQPGDRIFVPEPPTFYVSGEVKGPGAFPIISGMTVRMAIARAGGVSEDGSLGKVKVSRGGHEIHVSLDSDVKPGDVITVGERLF